MINKILKNIFHDSLRNRKFKRTALIWNKNCNIINDFTVTFDKFNVSLLNKMINFSLFFFLQNKILLLNGSVSRDPQKYKAKTLNLFNLDAKGTFLILI